tara:strand:- start:1439 stop:1942 length:504 start_codon:yes stop_codon:yes gene_type:complete
MQSSPQDFFKMVMLHLLFEGMPLAKEISDFQKDFALPLTTEQLLSEFSDELDEQSAKEIEKALTCLWLEFNTDVYVLGDAEEPPLFPNVIDASKVSQFNWFGLQQHLQEIFETISDKALTVKCICGSTYQIKAIAALSFVYHGLLHCFACDVCNNIPEIDYTNDFGV